jgi:hypothetical protein
VQHPGQTRLKLVAGKGLLKQALTSRVTRIAVLIATHSQSSSRTRISLWLVIDGKV